MKKKFNSNLVILIAVVLNFLITNMTHNKDKVSYPEAGCGLLIKEKFNSFQDIIDIIFRLMLFQQTAIIESTLLLAFITGISVFLISRDYNKTLVSIFIVVIINTVGLYILNEITKNIIGIPSFTNIGCSILLIKGELNFNTLFYYHSLMPISSALFTYFLVSLCISFIN